MNRLPAPQEVGMPTISKYIILFLMTVMACIGGLKYVKEQHITETPSQRTGEVRSTHATQMPVPWVPLHEIDCKCELTFEPRADGRFHVAATITHIAFGETYKVTLVQPGANYRSPTEDVISHRNYVDTHRLNYTQMPFISEKRYKSAFSYVTFKTEKVDAKNDLIYIEIEDHRGKRTQVPHNLLGIKH